MEDTLEHVMQVRVIIYTSIDKICDDKLANEAEVEKAIGAHLLHRKRHAWLTKLRNLGSCFHVG